MQFVRPRLDPDVHHHAGFHAVVGGRSFLGVEFLYRIEWQETGRCALNAGIVDHCLAVIGIIVVSSIDEKVIVVRAVPV
jgi:hypothetical protein